MADDSQLPDRRPLLYGVVAVALLLTAAALFWPHGEDESEPGTMVLTPESLQVSSEEAPLQTADGTTAAATPEDAGLEIEEEPLPHGEKEIVDATGGSEIVAEEAVEDADPPARQSRPEAMPESAHPRQGATPTPAAVIPAESGNYVLNVGSFGDRSNADRMVLDLKQKGVPAHVRAATADGKTVYRVRVGYFDDATTASRYARILEQEHDLDSWASRR